MGRHKKPDKLTQENAQALAAGMSYGKWKAMQPVVAREQKPTKPTYNVQKCEYCGVEFIDGANSKRKYCTDQCCKNAWSKKRREMRGEK